MLQVVLLVQEQQRHLQAGREVLPLAQITGAETVAMVDLREALTTAAAAAAVLEDTQEQVALAAVATVA
jgi:hypothetical protein